MPGHRHGAWWASKIAVRNDVEKVRLAMTRLVKQYGRCGYRKVTELPRVEG